MAKGYCTGDTCIKNYLKKENKEYFELINKIRKIEKQGKIGIKNEDDLFLRKKLKQLKIKERTFSEGARINNGVCKGDNFYPGDDCPDCGFALYVDGSLQKGLKQKGTVSRGSFAKYVGNNT